MPIDNRPRLELHRPSRAELTVRQAWLKDPAMMSYNAGWHLPMAEYDNDTGCFDWPESQWSDFLSIYATDPATADYFYLHDSARDEFVGHAHYRVNPSHQAEIGINVIPTRRNEGLGREGLTLLVDRIWSATTVAEIVNEFEDERISAVALHRSLGFLPGPTKTFAKRVVREWALPRGPH